MGKSCLLQELFVAKLCVKERCVCARDACERVVGVCVCAMCVCARVRAELCVCAEGGQRLPKAEVMAGRSALGACPVRRISPSPLLSYFVRNHAAAPSTRLRLGSSRTTGQGGDGRPT